jgi:hypothetical protein
MLTGMGDPYLIRKAVLNEHLAADAIAAQSIFTHLLLLRSIAGIQALTYGLDLAQTLEFAVDHILDELFDISRTLQHIHALEERYDIARRLKLESVAPLVEEMRQIVTDALVSARRSAALDRARTLGVELTSKLKEIARFSPDYDTWPLRMLGIAQGQYLDSPADASAGGTFEQLLDDMIGSGLSFALTYVLRRDFAASLWPGEFIHALSQAAGLDRDNYSVSPDQLVLKVREGAEGMRTLMNGKSGSVRWSERACQMLEHDVIDIVERRRPMTKEMATAVRLLALCSAAEAGSHRATKLASTFNQIAAGITLLERRATGQAEAIEAIVLAVE